MSVGLESMASTQLNITLNGDYTLNGVICNSGTSYILKVSGTQVSLNGVLVNNASFIPSNLASTIKINSSVSRNYRGTLSFKIIPINGIPKVVPVNTINIEEYLKGVVGKEMSDYFPIEALKAQAVAARNYALANVGKHSTKGYSICDTTDCQVYGGYDASLTRVISAVDATEGKVLLSGTSLVSALYSANDGGYTEDSVNVWGAPLSYLKAKQDSYDTSYIWSRTFTTKQLNDLFKLNSKVQATDTFVKIDLNLLSSTGLTKFDSGRIKNISLIFKNLIGTQYTLSYGKYSAKTFLNFPSALYDVSYDASTDTYTFNGKGNGHGLGMSQVGAKNRAAVGGQTFEEILKFYYEGTTILNIATNNTVITSDLVTFNSQGGNAISSKTVDYNNVVTTPTSPKKVGYTFGGWYKEIGCKNVWNFATSKVIVNTTLYAKWTVVPIAPIAISITTPKNLKVSSSSYNSINISFSAVTLVTGYEVYRATSISGQYVLISTITGTSYNNTGLITNKAYYYKVKAYKMVSGVKRYSVFSSIITTKPIPAVPYSLKAISSSYNSISTSWKAVSGASGYELYRSSSIKGSYALISRTPKVSYNNTSLTTNMTYYYKVRAYRMVGTLKVYSYFLNVINAKPIPAAPTGVKATRSSSKSIKIVWGKVTGANGYLVYRATSSNGTYSLLTKTPYLYYTSASLTPGKTYYYKIKSYRTVGKTIVYSNLTSAVYARP